LIPQSPVLTDQEVIPLIIDVFNHFYPKEYMEALPKPLPEMVTLLSSEDTPQGKGKSITDLNYRTNQMKKFRIDKQILSLPGPTLDDLPTNIPVEKLNKICRAANNGIASIADNSHGRFKGVATVSLLDVQAAVEETERAVKDLGLLGVQVLSNVRGKPLDLREFDPFYSKVSQLGCGLWIHPAYIRKTYDWMNDEYNMNMMMGWGIDTALATFRIMRGGVFERHSNLKIITHHLGTLIPLMAGRINGFVMGQGKNGAPPSPLKKTAIEYLKMFYVDTAEGSWKPAMDLAYGFYGSSHMLFGTDYPWGNTPKIIENVKALRIPEEEKKMILGENAEKLFRIE
jgi:predicted TIM-barrel fold metal-dependent hydrolase